MRWQPDHSSARPRPTRQHRRAGFVLVNALIVIAALSAVAVYILRESTRSQSLMATALQTAQLAEIISAGEMLAARLLAEDDPTFDHPGEKWALRKLSANAAGGTVTVSVHDLQGRLNLNLLARSNPGPSEAALLRLALANNVSPETVKAITDRYSPNRNATGRIAGSNERWFMTGDLAHPAALPELLTGDGAALAPSVATLPRAARVNLNTAPAEVLSALLDMPASRLKPFLDGRADMPLLDDAEARAFLEVLYGPDVASAASDRVGVASEWFIVDSQAKLGEQTASARAILYRNAERGTVTRFSRWQETP